MTFDASELRAFSRDLGDAPPKVAVEAGKSVFRGATQIKSTMRADMQASPHFKGAARAIDFDIVEGDDSITAVIGPKVGPGQSGGHAGIAYGTNAYAGGARGGASVRDPQAALDEEAPRFEAALDSILRDAL